MVYGSVSKSSTTYHRFYRPSQLFAGHTDLVITLWNVVPAANGGIQQKDQCETEKHKNQQTFFTVSL